MRVVNRAPYCLSVFASHRKLGRGIETKIWPEQSVYVMGPYDEEKGCYVSPSGLLICHEPSEDENRDRFTVPREGLREFQIGEMVVTVKYHSEALRRM